MPLTGGYTGQGGQRRPRQQFLQPPPAYMRPYAESTASSSGGSTTLPSIALRLPGVRARPCSGLTLAITTIPAKPPNPLSVARERPPKQRLSSSDSAALASLRDGKPRRAGRSHTAEETLLQWQQPAAPASWGESLAGEHGPLFCPARPPSSLPRPPSAMPRVLPPIASPELEEEGHGSTTEDSEEQSESSEEESEIFSDEASDAPPSRPGFESESEKSAQFLSVPYPDISDPYAPFPATIIQDHAHLDNKLLSASVAPSELSPRVDNIVRAFQIHGPLDRVLLGRAINEVVRLHPLLSATFQRSQDKLYVKTAPGKTELTLETPIIGHEKPEDLITSARRKLFALPVRSDLCPLQSGNTSGYDTGAMSLASLSSTGSTPPMQRFGVARQQLQAEVPKKKMVSFAGHHQTLEGVDVTAPPLPSLGQLGHAPSEKATPSLLVRAKLVAKNPQEHILVLSFSRVACDFWSSCLFVLQVVDAYTTLERRSSQHRSHAPLRPESKRSSLKPLGWGRERESLARGREREGAPPLQGGARRLLQRRAGLGASPAGGYSPPVPPRLHFQQLAQRESQLLKMAAKEQLWSFWEMMVTAIVLRQRGPNRTKVIPPVRIPSGLGDKSLPARGRPQTSRLRPLTARNRPTTARRPGGVFGAAGLGWEALAGPKTKFHFIKIEEEVCASFRASLPEEYLTILGDEDLRRLLCLGAYVLMLGRCCRGWGQQRDEGRREEGRREEGRGRLQSDSRGCPMVPRPPKPSYHSDPLQRYGAGPRQLPLSPLKRARQAAMGGGRLDVGTFLVGVEVSGRESTPRATEGLLGPLTNDAAIKVNLSSCPTFADLLLSLSKLSQLALQHGHFPFATVADEHGMGQGLPVRFSFLRCHDIRQLTNPAAFYFPETAVGVEGHGLARLGNKCYVSPLNTKMVDSCHMELVLWESWEGESVSGGLRHHVQVIRSDLVETFGAELVRLITAVAMDPCQSLTDLANQINPPFLSASQSRSRRVL